VPITNALLPFECVRFVTWRGKPVRSIKKTFARGVEAPATVTPYALRHTMATELRRPLCAGMGSVGQAASAQMLETGAKSTSIKQFGGLGSTSCQLELVDNAGPGDLLIFLFEGEVGFGTWRVTCGSHRKMM
jgi:hypothetical protein